MDRAKSFGTSPQIPIVKKKGFHMHSDTYTVDYSLKENDALDNGGFKYFQKMLCNLQTHTEEKKMSPTGFLEL